MKYVHLILTLKGVLIPICLLQNLKTSRPNDNDRSPESLHVKSSKYFE